MKRHLTAAVLLSFLFITIMQLAGSGCANIIPPTGGPRDSLPPVLISASPKDSVTRFTGSRIELNFDEYVQLDNNLNDMLIVSPTPEKTPIIEARLRTVTIRLRDSLQPNTTYSLDFGRALKDVNEGNVLRNFSYVFTTGDSLATGTVSGNVKLAETGAVDSTLIVLLHKNLQDSAIRKLKADYYTRLDSSGNFTFRYLPRDTFNIYVLPNDYSKRYDDSTKLFAFYNSPLVIGATGKLQLYAYQEVKQGQKTSASSSSTTTGRNQDKSKDKKEEDRLRYSTNLDNGQQSLLDSFIIVFSKPVKTIKDSLIKFSDTSYKAIPNVHLVQADTTAKRFAIVYPWTENKGFKLILDKEAFADSTGLTLAKTDTLTFFTKKETQYGSLRLRFNNIDTSQHPVLQLFQNNIMVITAPLVGREWYQKLVNPGSYEIRILNDTNHNGHWDPGNFDEKLQPEIVRRLNKELNVRANWDNETDITL